MTLNSLNMAPLFLINSLSNGDALVTLQLRQA